MQKSESNDNVGIKRGVGKFTSFSTNLSGFLYDPLLEQIGKTKVVCTIGPASWSYDGLNKLLKAGMCCARLNFSHGDHKGHQKVIDTFRKVVEDSGLSCALMLDTKGPEIRTKSLKPNPQRDNKSEWLVEAGLPFIFRTDDAPGDASSVATTYLNMAKFLVPGDTILVDDGLLGFIVDKIDGGNIHCTASNGGLLGTHKGVNLPGAVVDLPAVTEKDKADIAFGVKNKVDFIAASFIRNKANVEEILNLPGVRECGVKIISKIENAEGLENFREILEITDGIMVARGDLAVEIPLEKVPAAQKMMIRHCNWAGKPVITATQMMESMTENPRPTRAEVTDVANAVFDGTDCVMLSGESAKGKYPTETVKTMYKICKQAENGLNYRALYRNMVDAQIEGGKRDVSDSVASSAVKTCIDVDAKLIIGLTESGNMAQRLSMYCPDVPILAVTPNAQVARQCLLMRAVYPLLLQTMSDTDKIKGAIDHAKKKGWVEKGDYVIVTSGVLSGNSGGTNAMTVEIVL